MSPDVRAIFRSLQFPLAFLWIIAVVVMLATRSVLTLFFVVPITLLLAVSMFVL